MCYSFESSIKGWFYSLAGCIILLLFSGGNFINVWTAIFTLTFTQIQIIEALIWKNIENNNSNENIVKYIPIALWCQPLMQTLCAYIYTKNIYFIFNSIIYLVMIIRDFNSSDKFSARVGEKGHIVWIRERDGVRIGIFGDSPLYTIIYLFGLIFPLFFIDNLLYRYSASSYVVLSCAYSFMNYSSDEFSSMWCIHGINYILLANILNLYLNK